LGFGLAQDVVGAVRDLARDGQPCALIAAAAGNGGVEAPSGLRSRAACWAAWTSAQRKAGGGPALASLPRVLLSADSRTLGSSPERRTTWRARRKRLASPISASSWQARIGPGSARVSVYPTGSSGGVVTIAA
jgi:hypothetical protein